MTLLMEDDAAEAKHNHFNYDKIVEQQNLSKKKKKKQLKKGEAPPDSDDFQVKLQVLFSLLLSLKGQFIVSLTVCNK